MAKRLPLCHKVSRLFQPINVVPLGAEVKNIDQLSKSHKLMVDQGVIAPGGNGFFYLLPLATKALEKLVALVDKNMAAIGAQKISCPMLTASHLWVKTGRLSLAGPELFNLEDRHGKQFILSPTHEESITHMLSSLFSLSHKQLPLLLYQMSTKFRDEPRPRFGLLRTREFLMKDLYSFDTTVETAQTTYQTMAQAYQALFETIGVNFVKVKGVSGDMGGKISHEFHYPAAIGDDTLRLCNECGNGWNRETNETGPCEQCGSDKVTESKGIEVGHMFQLDTRYSVPLKAQYTGPQGRQPLVMGSYGLGLSRILAATVEVLSLPDQLRWPPLLAPYSVVIIPPKEGSKESKTLVNLEELYWSLQEVPELVNNVIVDDRSYMTIGKRLMEARKTGYPLAVVVGRAASDPSPKVELCDVYTGDTSLHSPADLVNVIVNSGQQSRISIAQ